MPGARLTQHADEAVVELLLLSELPEDDLAELWDDVRSSLVYNVHVSSFQAPNARFSTTETSRAPQGYLSKRQFLVLLSELQAKLGMIDDNFSKIYLGSVDTSQPRNNPFKKQTGVNTSHAKENAPVAKLATQSMVHDKEVHLEEKIPSEVRITEAEIDTAPTDGYAEYVGAYGAPFLGQASTVVARRKDLPKPLVVTLPHDSDLPIPVTNSMDSSFGDKEVIKNDYDTKGKSPTRDSEKEAREVSGSAQSMNQVVNVTEKGSPESLNDTQGKQETKIRTSPIPTRQFPPRQSATSPGTYEVDTHISTLSCDELALQRLKTLQLEENPVQPEKKDRKATIGKALYRIRNKGMIAVGIAKDAKVRSGFSYETLSRALRGAVMEGNVRLTASLFKLGADVNFSNPRSKEYHYIMDVAAITGNIQIVNLFIDSGADGITTDHALTAAYFANQVDIAMRLVPHADFYHLHLVDKILRPFQHSQDSYTLLRSSLGQVCRDYEMPAESRLQLLHRFFDEKSFDPAREVERTQSTGETVYVTWNILDTLVAAVNVDGVETLLAKMDYATCCRCIKDTLCQRLDSTDWREKPKECLRIVKHLLIYSAPIDVFRYNSDTCRNLGPLGEAVLGESYEGVDLLLKHGADPNGLLCARKDRDDHCRKFSVLAYAASQGNLKLCERLVDAGADIWRRASEKEPLYQKHPPLWYACEKGHCEVVAYLLGGKAKIAASAASATSAKVSNADKDKMLDICLDVAVKGFQPMIVEALQISGASLTADTVLLLLLIFPSCTLYLSTFSTKSCQKSRLANPTTLIVGICTIFTPRYISTCRTSQDHQPSGRIHNI